MVDAHKIERKEKSESSLEFNKKINFTQPASYNKTVDWAIVRGISEPIWPSNLQEKSVLLFKRPATHLWLRCCCGCPWATLIIRWPVSSFAIATYSIKKTNPMPLTCQTNQHDRSTNESIFDFDEIVIISLMRAVNASTYSN